MIKVLEERPVPRETVTCSNCNSLLEYGNADLHVDYEKGRESAAALCARLTKYFIYCPVCSCKVDANWITKKD